MPCSLRPIGPQSRPIGLTRLSLQVMATAPLSTRDRLIHAAARLFLLHSFHGVGVSDICAAAEAPKGSLYHCFASKSDLAIAVIDHHSAALWELLDDHERSAAGPVAKIRATAK